MKPSLNFQHFQKEDDPHSWCISKVKNSKNVVRSMSRNSCFRLSFEKEHGKRLPKQLKYQRQQMHHIYCSTLRNFSCKKSLLVICKILRLFVNIQSSDDKHSLLTRGNLRESIQIQFSLKERTFTKFFSAISRSSINFEHFQKKDDPHSCCLSELTDIEKRC